MWRDSGKRIRRRKSNVLDDLPTHLVQDLTHVGAGQAKRITVLWVVKRDSACRFHF